MGTITLRYQCRLGNRLFQYCFGKILEEETGYKLLQSGICEFDIPPNIRPINFDKNLKFRHRVDLAFLKKEILSSQNIKLRGAFQNYSYYINYRDKIRNEWLKLKAETKDIHKEDILVHVRLGDFIKLGIVLSFDYYKQILETINIKKKIYLCSDCPNHPYMDNFKKFNPIKVIINPIETLRFAKNFNTIIMSNSTFAWWMAFFSDAQNVYLPMPKYTRKGSWAINRLPNLDLRVPGHKIINTTVGRV